MPRTQLWHFPTRILRDGRIFDVERLPNDQHNRERIFRELGEVMLAIEVAQARVEKALDTLDKNELFDDHAVSALKEAQGKLEAIRKLLHQRGYLSVPQLPLF